MMRARSIGVVFLLAGLAACSQTPEEALLEEFFRAVARGDRVPASGITLDDFAIGPVASWEIVDMGSQTEGPYRIPELREEVTVAEQARDEQFQVLYGFRQANREALDRIAELRADDPEHMPAGRLGGIAARWDELGAERRQLVRSISELQMALEEERRRTDRSLMREAQLDYLTGRVLERELVVRVTGSDGGARDYRFQLMRYELMNEFEAGVLSRWIIAGLETAGS